MRRIDTINLGPGPAAIPTKVLEQFAKDLVNYEDLGMGIAELSHRSMQAAELIQALEDRFRRLLQIPDNYSVLFMQGGSFLQFSAILYNMIAHKKSTKVANYIVNGSWSESAYQEALRLGLQAQKIIGSRSADMLLRNPSLEEIKDQLSDDPLFLYYCVNETISGIAFQAIPKIENVDLICDASSHLLSMPFEISKHAIVFACAQKNFGITGLSVVICRNDIIQDRLSIKELLDKKLLIAPTLLDYKVMKAYKSVKNTIPMQNVLLMNLYLEYIEKNGGLEEMQNQSIIKSNKLYYALDKHSDVYTVFADPQCRSRMNVAFKLRDENLNDEFVKTCEANGLRQFKGHRSLGGIRFSIYNGISTDQIVKTAEILDHFGQQHSLKSL